MIRKEIRIQSNLVAATAIKDLITKCDEKQRHPQDLLLCIQHGSILNLNNKKSFLIGPGEDGLASFTHLNFISEMTDRFLTEDPNFFKNLDKNRLNLLEQSIHLQKLIYLKIWENTYLLKLLTQLVRLATRERYDWELSIPFKKGNTKSDHIRNKIRNQISQESDLFHSLIKDTYSQQIRNAIAHSQYRFIQGGIYYSNYKSDKFSLLEGMGFEDWEKRFSKTISLYFMLIEYMKDIHSFYVTKTLSQNNQIEILVPLENKTNGYMLLEYEKQGNRWIFKN